MSRMSMFTSPFMLGFDELERVLDAASKSSADGYPPYNIEKITSDEGQGDALRITIAVAGFCSDELDVSLDEKQLTISGQRRNEDQREYLHQGIAARQFQKTFVLADGMEVKGANLENGLLSVDLVRPPVERVVRTIKIRES